MADFNKPAEPQRTDDQVHEGDYCPVEPGSAGQQMHEPSSSTVSQVAEQGKQLAGEFVEQGKQIARDMTGRGKAAASDLAQQVQSKLYQLLGTEKDHVADRLDRIGKALHQVCENLQGEDDKVIASYASSTADSIERISRHLHDRDFAQLIDRVEGFARKQPEVFLGASFLGGLLLARFIKTSWSSANREMSREPANISAPDRGDQLSEPGGTHI